MARNHTFPTLAGQKLAAANSGAEPQPTRPRLAFADRGAMAGFARGIDKLTEQATIAKELEAKLTAGQVVVELDPHLIDGSFISDRMMHDDAPYQALRSAIEERGQETPILVRPHPNADGRYQIA